MIFSCGKPLDGIDVIVTTDALAKAPTLVQFVNSNAESTTAIPASIEVTITGADKDLVQTEDGGNTSFKATNGILALSLSRKANPTTANPVVFTITASPAGYAPVIKTFSITNASSRLIVTLPIIETARPGDGLAYVSQNNTLIAGTTAATATTIIVPTRADAPQSATVTIPANTQMKDANGNVINNATTLTSKIIHFGTGYDEGYNAFPGGFTPTNVIGADGKIIPQVVFITAGSLSINMTAGTTPVKSFSKPVELKIEISKTQLNPRTGVVGNCTSKAIVAYASTSVIVTDVTDGSTKTFLYATNGKISTSFINGHKYYATTIYQGKSKTSATFTVDRNTNVNINGKDGLTGTAVYDTASRKLNINASFTVGNCG